VFRQILAGLVLALAANEYVACRSARELRAQLPTLQDSELEGAWTRYASIRERSLGLASGRVSEPLVSALLVHADRVIADFRHERPTVREKQWDQARTWLSYASRIQPSNERIVARLRYCEGHLARINGEARLRDSSRRPQAERYLHDAVTRFEEAARLDRSWPDPWLGLLRTHIYGHEDADKGVEALNEAARRGYRPGRREFAQVGDAYQAKAERGRRDCDSAAEDRRCACLLRCADAYRQAISWYGRAEGFAETSRAISRADDGLETVTDRMLETGCPLEQMVATGGQ
jgi:hypothetical protein